MIARPVARYLVRFGPGESIEAPFPVVDEIAFEDSLEVRSPEENASLIEEARLRAKEEARAEGREEGYAAARAEYEAALIRERSAGEERLVAARHRWTADESERLAAGLVVAVGDLKDQIAASVERILRPFLMDTLRNRAIEDLVREMEVLLASDDHPVIKISGADDLLTALRQRLPATAIKVDYFVSESPDLTIVANHTVIESRLGVWIERLRSAEE